MINFKNMKSRLKAYNLTCAKMDKCTDPDTIATQLPNFITLEFVNKVYK